ncbi:MAG: ABC transporter permease [Chloroflexota bacterium]
MLQYFTIRILQGLLVIWLISIVTFVVMRLMPGDPVMLLLGEGEIRISQEEIDAIRAKWGLDQPYYQQYLVWVGNLVQGDFGVSLIRRGVPVRDMIFEALPVTLQLNVYAMLLALIVAIPAGIYAGIKRNSFFDYFSATGSSLGVAMPNFWLSLMLIIIFAVPIKWIPVFGLKTWQGLILPIVVMATGQTAVLTRVMRSSIIEVLQEDYVRTAHAKGLAYRNVMTRHAVRNALLPIVTVIGFQIAFILSGTIVVEQVFALPGIGRLLIDSVFRLDYQVVQSLFVLLAVVVVVSNLITDLLYAFIDPRIRINT